MKEKEPRYPERYALIVCAILLSLSFLSFILSLVHRL